MASARGRLSTTASSRAGDAARHQPRAPRGGAERWPPRLLTGGPPAARPVSSRKQSARSGRRRRSSRSRPPGRVGGGDQRGDGAVAVEAHAQRAAGHRALTSTTPGDRAQGAEVGWAVDDQLGDAARAAARRAARAGDAQRTSSALVEEGDPVGDGLDEARVVAGHAAWSRPRAARSREQLLELGAAVGVEAGGGLVEQRRGRARGPAPPPARGGGASRRSRWPTRSSAALRRPRRCRMASVRAGHLVGCRRPTARTRSGWPGGR